MDVQSTVLADAGLTPRQAEAFILRHRDDLPEPQAARLMQVGERRVRRLVSEARRRLACRGVVAPALPVGRPRSHTVTGNRWNFDTL